MFTSLKIILKKLDIFSKMNEVNLSLLGKQLTVFLWMMKLEPFFKKQNFGKLVSTVIILQIPSS